MLVSRSLLLIAGLALAGCGSAPSDRAISGGAIGAAGGTAVGAVTGLTLLQGAAIGAAAGAATGVLTDPSTINLGEPVWRNWPSNSANRQTSHASAYSNMVASTQSGLARLGYEPGPSDGVIGPKTQSAIREYQNDHGLPIDGRPSPELERHILAQLN